MNGRSSTVFTAHDQQWFAEASGDRNPIHLDAVEARRLLSGQPVVHGVHVLLSAFERYQALEELLSTTTASSFENPIGIGQVVSFAVAAGSGGRTFLDASVGGLRCVRTTLGGAALPAMSGAAGAAEDVGAVTVPIEIDPELQVGRRYATTPGAADLARHFPNLHTRLGPSRLSSLAALSYFVGMVCPGRHSLLSSIKIDFRAPAKPAPLTFAVRAYHPTYRLFDIDVDGPIRAHVQAFQRPAVQSQPGCEEIARSVRPDEFHGTRSLIVGGSRGLGELTAKIIATGGGDVIITYRTGRDDAERVSGDINRVRPGACKVLPVDVAGGFAAIEEDARSLDAAYYFPTPRIFRKSAALFNPEWLREFTQIYADGFFDLCALLERSATRNVRVFFPSSTAVAERPKGLTEYSMAKAAAEVLVEDINRSFKKVKVIASRLPRLQTDQTATILDAPSEPGIATLLPIIRTLYQ